MYLNTCTSQTGYNLIRKLRCSLTYGLGRSWSLVPRAEWRTGSIHRCNIFIGCSAWPIRGVSTRMSTSSRSSTLRLVAPKRVHTRNELKAGSFSGRTNRSRSFCSIERSFNARSDGLVSVSPSKTRGSHWFNRLCPHGAILFICIGLYQ